MQIDGWKCNNHAATLATAPHEAPNLKDIGDVSIWKVGGDTLLARWSFD